MTEYISDRMSEYMPDSMSAGGDHSKKVIQIILYPMYPASWRIQHHQPPWSWPWCLLSSEGQIHHGYIRGWHAKGHTGPCRTWGEPKYLDFGWKTKGGLDLASWSKIKCGDMFGLHIAWWPNMTCKYNADVNVRPSAKTNCVYTVWARAITWHLYGAN